jgi:hypothetical protein
LRYERQIFDVLFKKLKEIDQKFKSNFDYRFIKEISILIIDLYLNHRVVRRIF